jgi:salicylate hydroxylase
MAVEDGAVIGYLLGSLCGALPSGHYRAASEPDLIPPLLKLYEHLRKSRTTVNVRGAVANRTFFHLPDGPEQARRDEILANLDWETPCTEWKWVDAQYQRDLLGHDAVDEALKAFGQWWGRMRSAEGRTSCL